MICKNCGIDLPDNVKFCLGCGAQTAPKNMFCPQCGTSLPFGAKFCKNCGSAIQLPAAPRPVQAPAPVVEDQATALLNSDPSGYFQSSPQAARTSPPVKPIVQPPSPAIKQTKPRKKKSGVVAGVIVAVLLVAAAAVAVYFILFHDGIRQAQLIQQAQAYEAARDFESAADAYSECVLIGSKDPVVFIALAEAYNECGDQEKALQALKDGYYKTGDERVWDALTDYEYEILEGE